MERAERDGLGALHFRFSAIARRRDHAVLHFRRGFVGKRQAQDFLAGKFRLGIEQIADALGDDAGLARARAGHDDQRAVAVLRRGALLGIELNARRRGAGMFKQVSHLESLQATTVAQALRTRINGNSDNQIVKVRLGTKIYVF